MLQFGRGKPSAGVFYDSDFTTIDNILAVALIYGMQGKNDCRMEIITLSRPNIPAAGFVDMVEAYYHGPAANFAQLAPIGMRTAGDAGATSAAWTAPFDKKKLDGKAVYENKVKRVLDTADPNTMYRNYLEAQYDQNAFFVLAGPATNLAALLAFRGMKDMIAAKIKYLVVAGGAFPNGEPEAHVKADIPAMRKVLAEWPTPIYMAGNEVGAALPFPGASVDKEFASADPNNPVADAYRAYKPMPYDSPSWSMAAALYAGRPKETYFKVSDPGTVTVADDGRTVFTASAQGKHQYLIADPAQKDKILQTYVELASAKPVQPQRFRPPNANAAAAGRGKAAAAAAADKAKDPAAQDDQQQ
jgi:inosine-uridine nucleoside N-ribohydrolase